MAYKKTCWYTVIAPLRLGVIAGSRPGSAAPTDDELRPLVGLGFLAGIAFQIQDDLLNLGAIQTSTARRSGGDLWEGKRTVMLNHFMRTAVRRPSGARACGCCTSNADTRTPTRWRWLAGAMRERGSIEHGRRLAGEYCERALEAHSGHRPVPRRRQGPPIPA